MKLCFPFNFNTFTEGATHVLLASIMLALLGSVPATAHDVSGGEPYFSLSGVVVTADSADIDSATGTTTPAFNFPEAKLKTETGWGVVGAYGWLFDNNWRLEIELAHRSIAMDQISSSAGRAVLEGDLDMSTGFVNVVHDFRGESFITPYFGIGAGGAYHKFEVKSVGGAPADFKVRDTFSLVYQAMLGLNFEVGDDMDIFAGYRFMGALKPDYDAFELDRLDIHHFEMGVKFYLGD
jgi:opacity protein-like surface antigen